LTCRNATPTIVPPPSPDLGPDPMNRLLVFLLLVLAGTAVFGYFRGWYSTTVSAGSDPGLTFTWHKDKFNADMSAAGSTIKKLSQGAVESIKGKAKPVSATESTITGKVTSVDTASQTVHLECNGQSIPLSVPGTMPGIEQLVGRNVTVTLEQSGDTFVVRTIAETR
jgi:hypothetical protein